MMNYKDNQNVWSLINFPFISNKRKKKIGCYFQMRIGLNLGGKMQCGFCGVHFSAWKEIFWTSKKKNNNLFMIMAFSYEECPECKNLNIFRLEKRSPNEECNISYDNSDKITRVYPNLPIEPKMYETVPKPIVDDFKEAYMILELSPKASAALSRRCLQSVSINSEGVNEGSSLKDQISFTIEKGILPTYLSKLLNAVRVVGNFGAHPIPDKATGEIVDVEPGEAELNLEVLEGLFDFYYVQPAKNKDRIEKINKKLEKYGRKERVEIPGSNEKKE